MPLNLLYIVWPHQVVFNDTSGSSDLSAVQVDDSSVYMAEDTSFVGFEGEVSGFFPCRVSDATTPGGTNDTGV